MTYSQVRAETHATRTHLLKTLMHHSHVTDLWHDDTDLVLITLKTGEKIMVYLVDLGISAHEIEKTLGENSHKGVYSLFMFWADMLLPGDGKRFIPQDWMADLLNLYGDKLYGYDVAGNEVYIFPVYFQPQPLYPERIIRLGKTVKLSNLNPHAVRLRNKQYHLADFEPPRRGQSAPRIVAPSRLHVHYLLLNIALDASPEDIRRAYRELARQYHPDLNPSAEATLKMQEINHAYTQIMTQFEGEIGEME